MLINAGVQCYVYAHRPDTFHTDQTPAKTSTPRPVDADEAAKTTPAARKSFKKADSDDGKKLSGRQANNNTTLSTPPGGDTSVASI